MRNIFSYRQGDGYAVALVDAVSGGVQMPKEQEMSIQYDSVTQECVVHFRGTRYVLPGKYRTDKEATKAAEAFCRRLGWAG